MTTAYDAIAPFYDYYWGLAFFERAAVLFEKHLGSETSDQSHVLDLCCGTGQFSAWLSGRGVQVTGVDASGEMISYARRKSPKSKFHQADMRTFRLDEQYDTAVCFYNSINQVLTIRDLRATLESVHRHLRPGGVFLFDVMQQEGYANLWEGSLSIPHEDRIYDLRYRYNRKDRLALCHVTARDEGAEAPMATWKFFQRPFGLDTILEELDSLHFRVQAVDSFETDSRRSGRVAIVASRE